jgi:hypothetical protein
MSRTLFLEMGPYWEMSFGKLGNSDVANMGPDISPMGPDIQVMFLLMRG